MFSPEDSVCEVLVQVVEDFPYELVIGRHFPEPGSVTSSAGGCSNLQESPWVPFILSTGTSLSKKAEPGTVGRRATTRPSEPEAEKAPIASRAP